MNRREALRVLGVGGVAGGAAAAGVVVAYPVIDDDPMGQLIAAINANWQHAEALSHLDDDASHEAYTREVMSPLWGNLYHGTPETTTIAGAAAALRYLLDLGGMPTEDAAVVRSVADFLERRAS